MKVAEFKIMREYSRSLIPKVLIDLEQERKHLPCPDFMGQTKMQYVISWLEFFDPSCFSGTDESEFFRFKILHLKKAFEWANQHYFELELGSGMGWLAVAEEISIHLDNNTWNKLNERKLIIKHMQITEWYQD